MYPRESRVLGVTQLVARHGSNQFRGSTLALGLAMLGAGAFPVEGAAQTLAIVGGTLIDGTDSPPLRNAVVVIHDEQIQCVGSESDCPVPESAERLDASGRWLIPGLIDTHVHLFWKPALWEEPGIADQLRFYLANGITTIRDASRHGMERRTLALRAAAELSQIRWPRIYVSGRVDARSVTRSGARDARELTARLVALGVDGIKIRNGLTMDDVAAVLDEAAASRTPVYGHTFGTPEDGLGLIDYTEEAVQQGLAGVMHVSWIAPVNPDDLPPGPTEPWNEENWVQSWLSNDSRWLYATPQAIDALIELMVSRGSWLEPTLVTNDFMGDPTRYDEYSQIPYLSSTWEAMLTVVLPLDDQERVRYYRAFDRMKDFVRKFTEAGGLVVTGADGLPLPGVGLHDEIRLLTESGLSNLSALQAATRNAAQALGWDDRIGTIEAGKTADLVILDADPLEAIENTRNIWRVIKGGSVSDPEQLRPSVSTEGDH